MCMPGRSWPGWSIVAGVLDIETGERPSERLPAATEAVLGWVRSLPGPVAVAYEAGPTGPVGDLRSD
jgi:transposase